MFFAFFGHPELYLAAALGAVAVASPIVLLLAKRHRYKTIPLIGVPALTIAVTAGVVYYQEALTNRYPPLTSDVVVIIDDSRSMGIADDWDDAESKERVDRLMPGIRAKVTADAPARIEALEAELADKVAQADKDADLAFDADLVRQRLSYWRKQQADLEANRWKPNRLQLVQAILADTEANWIPTLLRRHQSRIHFLHLDDMGCAVTVPDGDIVEPGEPQVERALQAIGKLEPVGSHSRLGEAIRGAIEKCGNGPPRRVLVFTDGNNTRGETIFEAARFAAEKGVQLLFVGTGNEGKPVQNERAMPDPVNVLLVEGQPRYEFRCLKGLDDESRRAHQADERISIRTLLLDADEDFHKVDSLSLASIPDTREALRKYNVVILGDCDPKHPRLKNHLKNLADYARLDRGSVVFLAGTSYNPNRYKGTPLEDILPVEPVGDGPPAEMPLKEAFRPNLTLAGRAHPIFRFDPDEETRMKVWTRLTPIYWCATGYRSKRDAAILAVHPALKGIDAGEHPLVVHRKVGTGQALFVGFDETWRWRLREDAAQFNRFWLQTLRYLAKPMPVGNWLWVDQDTPYVIGDPIRIRARLPQPLADKRGPVKVSVHFTAPWAKEATRSALTLIPAAPDANEFVATITRAREGTYRFVLTDPELADIEAQGVPPSAEAIVELPVGESKNFGVNMNHLREAADPSRGIVFTLGNAGQFLEMLPAQQ